MDKDKVAQEILNAAQQLTAADDFTELSPEDRKKVLAEYDKRADELVKISVSFDVWWHKHNRDIIELFKKMYPRSSSEKINEYIKKRGDVTRAIYELAVIVGMPISDMPEE